MEFYKPYKTFIAEMAEDIEDTQLFKEIDFTLREFYADCITSSGESIPELIEKNKGLPTEVVFRDKDKVEVLQAIGYGDEDLVLTMQEMYIVDLKFGEE